MWKRLLHYLLCLGKNAKNFFLFFLNCSIEFDKDGEFFAVAGVTRMIKIYDYNLVVEFNGINPYPIEQLQCNSKIRCNLFLFLLLFIIF